MEDTDGDGFDKKKVFADNLFFPTGYKWALVAWVGSLPNLLFIPDRDGNDVPDGKPEVVSMAEADRTATRPKQFHLGPDGWFMVPRCVHSYVGKPGAPDSERQRINAGVWRYHPTKEKFEVFGWGTSNPWGIDFDDRDKLSLPPA